MIKTWWRHIVRLFLRRKAREPEDGLPYPVGLWMRELIDEGIDPRAAREEALRSFGLKGYPPICMKLIRLP
jgi:hypothetical protein